MESLLGWALTQSLNLWLDITCMSLFSLWNYLLWYIRSLYIMVPCLFLVRLLYVCELGFILVLMNQYSVVDEVNIAHSLCCSLCRFDGDGYMTFCCLFKPVFLSSFLEERLQTYNFSIIFPLQNTTTVSLQLCVFNMWGCFLVYNQTINIFHNKSNRSIFHNNVYSEGKIST